MVRWIIETILIGKARVYMECEFLMTDLMMIGESRRRVKEEITQLEKIQNRSCMRIVK